MPLGAHPSFGQQRSSLKCVCICFVGASLVLQAWLYMHVGINKLVCVLSIVSCLRSLHSFRRHLVGHVGQVVVF